MTSNTKCRARRAAARHRTEVVTAEGLESRVLLAVTPFDAPVESSGVTPVTLYPIEAVSPGVSTRVGFGVPFAKGFVTDLSTVRLLGAGGAEVPVFVKLLTPWRDLSTGADLPSVRSALVQLDVSFPDSDGDGDADPLTYSVEWGLAARSLPALSESPARQGWVRYDNAAAPAGTDYKAADDVWEPPAYALFTPGWYGQALLKTRLLPAGSDPAFAGYDAAFANFAATAVNEVDPRVTAANLIHYTDTDEPWLFDRATALYQLAFRAGDVHYLRHAHRGAQFYANHIDANGRFDLKGDDIKYVTGEAVATDYWLTGDARMLDVHRRMIPMFDNGQTAAYSPGHFWTERHNAYKLLGYVTGFELLGDASLATRARDTFTVYVNHQNNPPAGAPDTGMLMHLKPDHGEGGTNEWIASPWMSVFLVDAAQRYYLHSGDARVANFVTRMADGINHVGDSMYYSDLADGVMHLQPYYLAGPGLSDSQHEIDEWGDMEHGVDVSKIFALAYFFSRQAGTPNSAYLGRFQELSDTGQAAFNYWTRPGGPASGLAVYRLTPARKFNWWFRTTADRDFLVGRQGPPPPDTQAPRAGANAAGVTTAGGTTHTFTVTYTDNAAVSVASLGTGDVVVTGPNGFSQAATFVAVDIASNGTPRTATYRITAPGGTWDAADNGTYTVALAAGQVTDAAGNAAAGGPLTTFAVSIVPPNPTIPTASAGTSRATEGWTCHWFTVTYSDDAGINFGSIGAGDVLVTGPNGYSQLAALSNTVSSDPRRAPVTYRIAAPGGSWDRADNGTYVINLRPNEVADASGQFVAAGVIGQIVVEVGDATAPAAGSATVSVAGSACDWFTVTYTDETRLNVATIDGNDARVTGPNGFARLAVLSNLAVASDGRSATATYRVDAPGGAWDYTENGTYTISLVPSQVADAAGNFAAAGVLGTFRIAESVPAPEPGEAPPVVESVSTNAASVGAVGEGQAVSVDTRYADADAADTHTVVVDWGDGAVTSVAGGATARTASATHAYAAGGAYDVTVTVTDSAGYTGTGTARVFVTGAGVAGDVLRVVGTAGPDTVRVNPSNGQLLVTGAFLPGERRYFAPAGITRVVILGGAGNDYISLYDTVVARGVLVGGDGDDTLFGGQSSLLIGGTGADRITGADGEDILVAGTTRLDNDVSALLAVLNGTRPLTADDASDDAAADVLNGNKGTDRFFGRFSRAGVLDGFNDLYRTATEQVIEI